MVFTLACWARFLSGKDEQGKDIPIQDDNSEVICPAAINALKDPKTFLVSAGLDNIGESQIASVAELFVKYLDSIYKKGIKASLEEFLGK
jgi:mannitol-1-phosphate/altronate dehydrogenase